MNTRTAVAALALLATLTLAGCAEAVESAGGGSTAPAATESSAPTSSESVEPLVAQTPAATPSGETGEGASGDDVEAAFLAEVRDRLGKIRTQIPDATDAQLLDAAHEACEALAPDLTGEDLSLIEGETRTNGHFMDSSAIIVAARLTICPIES